MIFNILISVMFFGNWLGFEYYTWILLAGALFVPFTKNWKGSGWTCPINYPILGNCCIYANRTGNLGKFALGRNLFLTLQRYILFLYAICLCLYQ